MSTTRGNTREIGLEQGVNAEQEGNEAVVEQDDAEDVLETEPQATIASTVFGLSNNIVGAGILSLPWCFKQSSIVEGAALMVWVGTLSAMSLILIAVCCELTQCFTFREMGERALGASFGAFLQVIMFVYTFFSCVSFLILTGDLCSGTVGVPRDLCGQDCQSKIVEFFDKRFHAILALTLLLLCPLCSLPDLNALRFTSLLSIFGMFYLLGLLIYEYIAVDSGHVEVSWVAPRLGLFSAAPIINVAFIAHYNVPRFYQEMKERSIAKFSTAVGISIVMCGSVYVAVGFFGYMRFGKDVESDFLKNFDQYDKAAAFGRLSMACVVLFTYPLAFNSLRASAIALLNRYIPSWQIASKSRYLALTYVLIALTFVPGSTIKDIGIVLDYKGAVLGGCIGFAFPAWIFLSRVDPQAVSWCCFKPKLLQVSPNDGGEDQALLAAQTFQEQHPDAPLLASRWKRTTWIFFFWAIVSGVMGVIITTSKVISGEK